MSPARLLRSLSLAAVCLIGFGVYGVRAQDAPPDAPADAPSAPAPLPGPASFGPWTLQSYASNGTTTCLLGEHIEGDMYFEMRAQSFTGMDVLVVNSTWALTDVPLGNLTLQAPHHQWSWPATQLDANTLHASLSDDPKASEDMFRLLEIGPQSLQLALPASVSSGAPLHIDPTAMGPAIHAFGICVGALPKPVLLPSAGDAPTPPGVQ